MSAFRLAVLVLGAGLTASSPAFSRTWHILNDGSGDARSVTSTTWRRLKALYH